MQRNVREPLVKRTFANEKNEDHLVKIEPVDYCLAYDISKLTEESVPKIIEFVNNLREKGLKLKSGSLSINDDIKIIQICASRSLLLQYAAAYAIELSFHSVYSMGPDSQAYCNFMRTPLTMPIQDSDIQTRAPQAQYCHHPRDITTAERSLIVYQILRRNAFGDEKNDYGIEKLLHQHVFRAAYPVHDGPWIWSEEGPLNDRQLLARYWGNLRSVLKQQPMDLIHKYFGPSVAFYFAWLGFYNKMLIPISILGIFCFAMGSVTFHESFIIRSEEVCHSNITLCPDCVIKNCRYTYLKNSCAHSKVIHLFDNPWTIIFAAITSIWATVFVELWRRKEAVLTIKWNLLDVQIDTGLRPEFEARTRHVRYSPITGNMELYEPKSVRYLRLLFTWSILLFMISIMLLAELGVILYHERLNVILNSDSSDEEVSPNLELVASFTGSLVSLIIIILFEYIYKKIAKWLTEQENPRTQIDFDNSYIYKLYILEFINYYTFIFYIAFVKARFFTYPGDKKVWEVLGGVGADLCDPTGCVMDLAIHLAVVMILKNLLKTLIQYVKPRLIELIKKCRTKKNPLGDVKEQWESDYMKIEVNRYNIMQEYLSMIIQYGFVTFFVAAFPPAPLFALINNLIELRVDSGKFVKVHRRSVAIKVAGMGAWNSILRASTYIGIATNAFVIAFTSDFIPRSVYQNEVDFNLRGYVQSSISVYDTSGFPHTYGTNVSICYYPGKRYPPNHSKKYELTHEYWYELAVKFVAVMAFEHILLLVTGLLAYAIPDIPFSVREHLVFQRAHTQNLKRQAMRNEYLRETEPRGDVTVTDF